MPWFSGKKKSTTDDDSPATDTDKAKERTPSTTPHPRPELQRGKSATSATLSPQTSPDKRKKSHSSSVREREKGAGSGGSSGSRERPKSPRHSKSFGRSTARKQSEDEHPLNLHPDELRRLSSRMSGPSSPAPQENGTAAAAGEPMETTPAPESVPGGFPNSNGISVNGDGYGDGEEGEAPAPPPHRSPRSPPPQKEEVDAEACKAAGNKFYKAGQYEKAIAEYTKGLCECIDYGRKCVS